MKRSLAKRRFQKSDLNLIQFIFHLELILRFPIKSSARAQLIAILATFSIFSISTGHSQAQVTYVTSSYGAPYAFGYYPARTFVTPGPAVVTTGYATTVYSPGPVPVAPYPSAVITPAPVIYAPRVYAAPAPVLYAPRVYSTPVWGSWGTWGGWGTFYPRPYQFYPRPFYGYSFAPGFYNNWGFGPRPFIW